MLFLAHSSSMYGPVLSTSSPSLFPPFTPFYHCSLTIFTFNVFCYFPCSYSYSLPIFFNVINSNSFFSSISIFSLQLCIFFLATSHSKILCRVARLRGRKSSSQWSPFCSGSTSLCATPPTNSSSSRRLPSSRTTSTSMPFRAKIAGNCSQFQPSPLCRPPTAALVPPRRMEISHSTRYIFCTARTRATLRVSRSALHLPRSPTVGIYSPREA